MSELDKDLIVAGSDMLVERGQLVVVAKVSGEHEGEMIVLVVGSATSSVALLNTTEDFQLDPSAPSGYIQFECDLASLQVTEYPSPYGSWNPEGAELALLDPDSSPGKRTLLLHEFNDRIEALTAELAGRELRYQLQTTEYDALLLLASDLYRIITDYREYRSDPITTTIVNPRRAD